LVFALELSLVTCSDLLVVENGNLGGDIEEDVDLLELSFIVLRKNSALNLLHVFLFINLVIVDPELGEAAVDHLLVVVERYF
jgi:hypothetical protein